MHLELADRPISTVFLDIGDTLVFDQPSLGERFLHACEGVAIPVDASKIVPALRAAEDHLLPLYVAGVDTDAMDVRSVAAAIMLTCLGAADLEPNWWPNLAAEFARQPFERTLHPEAKDLIADLKARGLRVGVISDWDAALPDLLKSLGIYDEFECVAVSEIVGARKPDPRLFRHAAECMGVDPSTCIHVGDFLELDVQGARSAGMAALVFDWRGRYPDTEVPRASTWSAMVDELRRLVAPA